MWLFKHISGWLTYQLLSFQQIIYNTHHIVHKSFQLFPLYWTISVAGYRFLYWYTEFYFCALNSAYWWRLSAIKVKLDFNGSYLQKNNPESKLFCYRLNNEGNVMNIPSAEDSLREASRKRTVIPCSRPISTQKLYK